VSEFAYHGRNLTIIIQKAVRKTFMAAMEIGSTGQLPEPDPSGKILVEHPTIEGTYIMRPIWTLSFTENADMVPFFLPYFRSKAHSIFPSLPQLIIDNLSDEVIVSKLKTAFKNMKIKYKTAKGERDIQEKNRASRRNQRKGKVSSPSNDVRMLVEVDPLLRRKRKIVQLSALLSVLPTRYSTSHSSLRCSRLTSRMERKSRQRSRMTSLPSPRSRTTCWEKPRSRSLGSWSHGHLRTGQLR
jgi:hypothetical protein